MPRKIRDICPAGPYHIIARGNARSDIVLDDKDRQQFLKIFRQVQKDYKWICFAYCLMDNHYHLFIETTDDQLSKAMHQLNGRYAQYFNKRHSRSGHVFEGRFTAIKVLRDSHFLQLILYIVRNPVRARIVKSNTEYRWSSSREMNGLTKNVFLDKTLIKTRKAEKEGQALWIKGTGPVLD